MWDKVYGTDDPETAVTLYNETDFDAGWALLLKAVELDPALGRKVTFTHDLVDVTRQAIAKKASKIYRVLDAAAAANSTERVASAGKLLLEALDDADKVLGTSQGFLFGAWVDAAQRLGTTADEKELYGWNAKMQVTFWEYPQPDPTNSSAVFRPSTLQDYACKQWSGLLRTYYKPRWELFINQTLAQLKEDPKATFDIGKFYADTYRWFDVWQASDTLKLASTPSGDPVAIAKEQFAKYSTVGSF